MAAMLVSYHCSGIFVKQKLRAKEKARVVLRSGPLLNNQSWIATNPELGNRLLLAQVCIAQL